MAKVFFSYSHKDEALRNELETHLAIMKSNGEIDAWNDRRIVAGDDFADKIDEQLNAADVILLLVSSDFFASNYCYEIETSRALERHREGSARVIPVILRPCDWLQTPLKDLMVVPRDGKPIEEWPNKDAAFKQVVEEIRRAVRSGGQPANDVPSEQPKSFNHPRASAAARSSNLRVTQEFTQREQDRFLRESYLYISDFFANSLAELEARNPGIEGDFQKIDETCFKATIYRAGEQIAQRFVRGADSGSFGSMITTSHNASRGSMNEGLSIKIGSQTLGLAALGMSTFSQTDREQTLTQQGGAEFLWSLMIEPLQR